MDLQGNDPNTILRAQAHVIKHSMGYVSSVSLRCATHLSIPDIINKHGRPITLPELVSALQINPRKSGFIYRIMRQLVHHGFFKSIKNAETKEETYTLTPSSRLLLKGNNNNAPSLAHFVDTYAGPHFSAPSHVLGKWLLHEDTSVTPFEFFHGMNIWDYMEKNREHQHLMDQAMDEDSSMLVFLLEELKQVFEGVSSFVEVGGGRGEFAKLILDAFPHLNCTVLDLPHVVANLSDSPKMKFVGGNMFEAIPSGEVVLLKVLFDGAYENEIVTSLKDVTIFTNKKNDNSKLLMLHAWNDEQCVKILKKCRESIRSSVGGKKVVIIDCVLDKNENESELTDAKLNYDIIVMLHTHGKERSKKDWQRVIAAAGLSTCKITITNGIRALIEAFP